MLEARTQQLLAKDGYPNTYTFTKAMGEKLLHKYHGDVPVFLSLFIYMYVDVCIHMYAYIYFYI